MVWCHTNTKYATLIEQSWYMKRKILHSSDICQFSACATLSYMCKDIYAIFNPDSAPCGDAMAELKHAIPYLPTSLRTCVLRWFNSYDTSPTIVKSSTYMLTHLSLKLCVGFEFHWLNVSHWKHLLRDCVLCGPRRPRSSVFYFVFFFSEKTS